MAGNHFIPAILTGSDNGGLRHTLVLDALHHRPHFFIIPHLEGVIFEGVKVGKVKMNNLLRLALPGGLFRLRGSGGRCLLHRGLTVMPRLFRCGRLLGGGFFLGRFGRFFLLDRLFRLGGLGISLFFFCFLGATPTLGRLFGLNLGNGFVPFLPGVLRLLLLGGVYHIIGFSLLYSFTGNRLRLCCFINNFGRNIGCCAGVSE